MRARSMFWDRCFRKKKLRDKVYVMSAAAPAVYRYQIAYNHAWMGR